VYDVVVIGAGLGGLMAAAKLAGAGLRVLVLEKKALPGGTSYVFRRGGYAFPMGPLSFGFPGRVRKFLAEAGIAECLEFRRSGFEIRTPALDVVISRPLSELESELGRLYPEETDGLARFFAALRSAIVVSKDMDLWHPDYFTTRSLTRSPAFQGGDEKRGSGLTPNKPRSFQDRGVQGLTPGAGREDRPGAAFFDGRVRAVGELSRTPAAGVLDGLVADGPLRNLLGSLGSRPSEMSMLNLALMWNVMAEEGIWFPDHGVHGLADLFRDRLADAGGELRLGTSVRKILVKDGRAAGVITTRGEVVDSAWVVSNADYKTTFLELLDAADIPDVDLGDIRGVPYTDSELCVYLGVRPEAVDLSAMRTEHLFYRHEIRDGDNRDPEDFDNRELEICHWSRKAPDLSPPGRAALVLRAGFPYERFAPWRLAEKKRRDGYDEFKKNLGLKLVRTAEHVLPGLSGAVEVMETATPLTYRDWGGRYEGSIAGWTWAARKSGAFTGKALVRTPVPGLLAAGAYATTELFLGGVPTALYTGSLAADIILLT
jgi:all-trans-retinol 13,14-reductase